MYEVVHHTFCGNKFFYVLSLIFYLSFFMSRYYYINIMLVLSNIVISLLNLKDHFKF